MGVFYHVSNDELTAGTILKPMYGQEIQNPHRYVKGNNFYYDDYIERIK
ncbi:DUF2441 domain-containing protein, partial [Bacillus toyonensis]